MSQRQLRIPLYFLDSTVKETPSTGNNAAWICKCSTLLLGRTGNSSGVDEAYRVDCACGAHYFVVPEVGRDLGRAIEVREVP